MRNIKLSLQYDGSMYHGWQLQPNADTVQQRLTDAVSNIIHERPVIIGCSRTDAGVHAAEYVCSFKTSSEIPAQKLPRAFNTFLPRNIVCFSAEDKEPGFHAINSAKSKRYVYKIENSEFPNPFNVNRVWSYRGSLDTEEMRRAAQCFLGTHDFVGFAASGFTAKTTVRTIYDISLEQDGDVLSLDIRGNGFLYNMVRIIAGTLVWVGTGKISADSIPSVIESRKRENAGITAPPGGLYLWRVEY